MDFEEILEFEEDEEEAVLAALVMLGDDRDLEDGKN